MTITTYASGTQSATVTTEHFLSSPNVIGLYVLVVDLSNMAANDVLELRTYQMVLTGGTQRVKDFYMFAGVQPTDALIFMTDQVSNELTDANATRFSLKQTFGTSRNFAWKVMNLEDFATITTSTSLLNTAQAEITTAPAINETPLNKIAFLFQALRNKVAVSSTSKTFFNDAGSSQWSKALSDDGTTYTEAEGS
jgi:hypothetical protein